MIIESIESNNPPRPGINVPLSLLSKDLFITDSIKSPIIPAIEVINPQIKTLQ